MEIVYKTKESQIRASKNYREKNPIKVKEIARQCAKNYYDRPENKEKQRQRMREYYHKKKAEKKGVFVEKNILKK
jgi:hypothetical protein